jgi:hypothetical protein
MDIISNVHEARVGDMQPQGDFDRQHSGPGHEPTDLSLRGIMSFAVGLTILGLVVFFVLSTVVMRNFLREERRELAARPERFRDDRGQFPEPRLQSSPPGDLTTMRKQDAQALNSYGWVDRKKGVARIPIDRAIDILAREGLPSRRAGSAAKPPTPAEGK